jgi:hypothetical protein
VFEALVECVDALNDHHAAGRHGRGRVAHALGLLEVVDGDLQWEAYMGICSDRTVVLLCASFACML